MDYRYTHAWNKRESRFFSQLFHFNQAKEKENSFEHHFIRSSICIHRTPTIHTHTYIKSAVDNSTREGRDDEKIDTTTNIILSSRDTLQGCVGRTTWHISYRAIILNDADKNRLLKSMSSVELTRCYITLSFIQHRFSFFTEEYQITSISR